MSEHSVVNSTFTLERRYQGHVSRVFKAWADPEIKARWFAPGSASYELDFRPGGVERNRVVLNGQEIGWETLYREIVQDQRIVYTSVLSQGETVATVSLTTVEFETDGEGTRLVLVEAGAYLDGHEQPAWREQGTGDWLDHLGQSLSS
jgi:uncharacterized protein YndB with AHSA1/START domain